MSQKKQSRKEVAHEVLKKLKSCGFNKILFIEKFNPTEYEKKCFNFYYGWMYGKFEYK